MGKVPKAATRAPALHFAVFFVSVYLFIYLVILLNAKIYTILCLYDVGISYGRMG